MHGGNFCETLNQETESQGRERFTFSEITMLQVLSNLNIYKIKQQELSNWSYCALSQVLTQCWKSVALYCYCYKLLRMRQR